MIIYWCITAWLYLLALCTIWIQVFRGGTPLAAAIGLSVLIAAGTVPFYILIRFMPRFQIVTAQMATAQAVHGIICIALSYAVLGPIRAIALLPLPAIFLLCAFSLSRKVLFQLAGFSVFALSSAISWLVLTRPETYQAVSDIVYLVATANVVVIGVFLAEQFNVLRRRLKTQQGELAAALERVEAMAFRDELTKLPNRRYMQDLLVSEERRHAQENSPLTVAMLDLDYFKRVNDKYGHRVGDETLCKFVDLLSSSLRTGDVLARWGGEEFLLLLPRTDPDTAVAVVERLRRDVNQHNLKISEEFLRITFSAGLAVVLPGGSSTEALNLADKAMFEAKAAGRNTVRQFVAREA